MNAIVGSATINSAFITSKNAVSTPTADGSDQFVTSVSGTLKRVTWGTLTADTNIVTGHSEDTSPATNDMVLTYDASAAALKKVTLKNLQPLAFTYQTNIPVPAQVTINVAHSLGGTPQIARAVLVCTVATNHLAIGDEIDLPAVRPDTTTDSSFGRPVASLVVNTTNAILGGFDTLGGVFYYQSKDGNGMQSVNTNFVQAKIYLYRFP